MHRAVKISLNIWGQGKRPGDHNIDRSYWNQEGAIKTYITCSYTLIYQEKEKDTKKKVLHRAKMDK